LECLSSRSFLGARTMSGHDNGGHRRQGETFNDLTLSPSVGFDAIGHWHGHITAGNVTGA
jgi:hypothetical protein